PSQTLGRVVSCNNFQDGHAFLQAEEEAPRGQRGRQRALLREGVYAINLALFVVITEDVVYRLPQDGGRELQRLMSWQQELSRLDGFSPVVIGAPIRSALPVATAADETPSARRGRARRAEDQGGRTLRCPECQHVFTVPPSDSDEEARTV